MSRFHRLEIDAARMDQAHQPDSGAAQQPVNTDALAEAGRYRRVGLFENALRWYSRALEQDRSLVAGWLGQVQMLIELQEYPEAELWGRKALEMFVGHGDLMAARAQAQCRMGLFQQAQALSDQSLAAREQSAYRWMVRGEVMLAQGEKVESHCFAKARQIDDDWLVPLEIARIYAHYGQFTKALMQIRLAVEKVFDQPYLWFLQGVYQKKLGLYRVAGDSFKRCLELAPRHQGAQLALESLHDKGGLWKRLISWVRRS